MNKHCKQAQDTIMRVYAIAEQADYEIKLVNAFTGVETMLDPPTARACILAGIMCGAAVLENAKEFAKQDPREIFLGVIQDAGSLYLRDLLQSEGKDNA